MSSSSGLIYLSVRAGLAQPLYFSNFRSDEIAGTFLTRSFTL